MKSFFRSATVLTSMHFTLPRLLLLFCVLLVMGAILWIGLAMLIGWAILRPPRMSAGKAIYHLRRLSPGDLGMGFEELSLVVRDARTGGKLNIAGWWIPASSPSDKCVVMLHGYADAKVGAIGWAPPFHDLNFNILATDLRAHGDSDGKFTTGGFFERDDVGQAIDQILNLYPDQTRQLVLFGASLGAAVALAAAAHRDDIAAIILESPFCDYEKAVKANIRLTGLPSGSVVQAAIHFAQWISGAKYGEVRPVDLLKKIKCPVLMIVGTEDELLELDDFDCLEKAARTHPASVFWKVENIGHLQAMVVDPMEYQRRIHEFLNFIV